MLVLFPILVIFQYRQTDILNTSEHIYTYKNIDTDSHHNLPDANDRQNIVFSPKTVEKETKLKHLNSCPRLGAIKSPPENDIWRLHAI